MSDQKSAKQLSMPKSLRDDGSSLVAEAKLQGLLELIQGVELIYPTAHGSCPPQSSARAASTRISAA